MTVTRAREHTLENPTAMPSNRRQRQVVRQEQRGCPIHTWTLLIDLCSETSFGFDGPRNTIGDIAASTHARPKATERGLVGASTGFKLHTIAYGCQYGTHRVATTVAEKPHLRQNPPAIRSLLNHPRTDPKASRGRLIAHRSVTKRNKGRCPAALLRAPTQDRRAGSRN
jgi:hypothetical protein